MKTVVQYTRLIPNDTNSLSKNEVTKMVCDRVYFEAKGPLGTAEFLVMEENGRATYVPLNWIKGEIKINGI